MTDLVVITEPTTPGVTVEQAKAHLRITHYDEDELLSAYIDTATRDFEDYTNSAVYETEFEVALDHFPPVICQLPRSKPFISLTSIKYTNSDNVETTLSPSLYLVDTRKATIEPAYNETWPTFPPRPSSAVVVRYKAGHVLGSPATYVEAGIRICICQMVGALYLNREAVTTTDRVSIAAYAQDPVARRLLERYKRSYAF